MYVPPTVRVPYSHFTYASLFNTTQRVVDVAVRALANPKKTGGYLCYSFSPGFVLLLMPVGVLGEEQLKKYGPLALEKATRLAANETHLSSRESRDEKLDRWGGAIRVPANSNHHNLIFSFSGFPELWDEAIVLALAWQLGLITEEDATARAIEGELDGLFLDIAFRLGKT